MNLQENVKFAAGRAWRRNFLQRKWIAPRYPAGMDEPPGGKEPEQLHGI
jgi:hypothetical protein